jgi:hypothetical protein
VSEKNVQYSSYARIVVFACPECKRPCASAMHSDAEIMAHQVTATRFFITCSCGYEGQQRGEDSVESFRCVGFAKNVELPATTVNLYFQRSARLDKKRSAITKSSRIGGPPAVGPSLYSGWHTSGR